MSPTAPHHLPSAPHAFSFFNARGRDGLTVSSRRSVLKAGLAGMAGISMPGLLRGRAEAAASGDGGASPSASKSVILLWMTGGPSHIDTWDVKPEMPYEIRGPFKDIPTALPGVHICEYLPKQASMMDKFTLVRSVDCRFSNHEPNMVMQTANREAAPRKNPKGHLPPAIASLVAKLRGPNHPAMPPYVVLNMKSRSHVGWGGYLGRQFDPFVANDVGRLLGLPGGLSMDRVRSRQTLCQQMDKLRAGLDVSGQMEAMDYYSQQAFEIVTPGDIAATIYHHFGIPPDSTYRDHAQRPIYIVDEGEVIRELL